MGSTATDKLILVGAIVGAVVPVWAGCGCWYLRQARQRRLRESKEAEDIVGKATIEAWNAYNRTFMEGFAQGEHGRDDQVFVSSTESTDEEHNLRPPLPCNDCRADGPLGTSRSLPSTTPDELRARASPASGGSAKSGGHRFPSLMSLELPPLGSPMAAVAGGSFLTLTLGVKAAHSRPALSDEEMAASSGEAGAHSEARNSWLTLGGPGDGSLGPLRNGDAPCPSQPSTSAAAPIEAWTTDATPRSKRGRRNS
mmetsp:Transcript_38384/g.81592  ORF Transcript_38384/g.81592 Transcript_38384/m.81592 type:complete len:254 (-) Transcript_38384:29-790(-)